MRVYTHFKQEQVRAVNIFRRSDGRPPTTARQRISDHAETSGEEDVKLLMFLHRNFLAGHLSSSVLTEIFFVTTRDHSMIGMRALVFLMAVGHSSSSSTTTTYYHY
jgi:hypothetical protein